MSHTTTLSSLAILKVNFDRERKDYIDLFLPFVTHVLGNAKPDPISSEVTQSLILEEFGLNIPRPACELVLKRLTKRGHLKKHEHRYVLANEFSPSHVTERRVEANRKIERVIHRLREFAQEKFNLQWTEAQTEEALTKYLSEFAIECLRSYSSGSTLPEHTRSDGKSQYVVNAFIRLICNKDPEIFDELIIIVKGTMLSNALLCPDISKLQHKFQRTTFYFDTPFLLQILGLEGEPMKNSAINLIQLLVNLKARLAFFEHTYNELHGALLAAETNLNQPKGRGSIVWNARESGLEQSDLALIRDSTLDTLAELSIHKVKTPAYTTKFQIDENILEGAIQHEIAYISERALLNDINSIRSIYELRSGQAPVNLEDSSAVLVTTNAALARAAFEYGKGIESSREVSTVITNFSLANVAWLKAPLGAPDLPMKELLAVCYAALQPKEELWDKYIAEAEKLRERKMIEPKHLSILRYSPHARVELMDLTLGSEEELSEQTVQQILEKVKDEIIGEHKNELEKSREAEQLALDKAQMALNEKEEIEQRVYWWADRVGQGVGKTCNFLLVVIVLGFVLWSSFLTKPFLWNNLLIAIAVSSFAVIGTSIAVSNLLFGANVRDMSEQIERHVSTYVRERILREKGRSA